LSNDRDPWLLLFFILSKFINIFVLNKFKNMLQKVKIKIKAIYALTRFNEYWDFNLTLCLLALAVTVCVYD